MDFLTANTPTSALVHHHRRRTRTRTSIFGEVIDPRMTGKMKVTVIATGFQREAARRTPNIPLHIVNYKQPAEMAVGSEGFYRKGADNLTVDLDFGSMEGPRR